MPYYLNEYLAFCSLVFITGKAILCLYLYVRTIVFLIRNKVQYQGTQLYLINMTIYYIRMGWCSPQWPIK